MQLDRLTVYNFKNLAQQELQFSSGLNCFVGSNGEGKTNLLDAIYYLSLTHSHLSHRDADTIRHGESEMSLRGLYTTDDGHEVDVLLQCRIGGRKTLSLNGKTYRRLSQHIGRVPMVMAAPMDQNLIDGPSDARRRFMDSIISQYDAEYLDSLIRYSRALDGRNALLRSESPIDDDLLSIYERQMDTEATLIYNRRCRMIEQLAPLFADVYSGLASEDEDISLSLQSHLSDGASLKDQLRESRQRDLLLGYTTRGPHRDELRAMLRGYPIRSEGSQGQRKTYWLALRLAQYQYLLRLPAMPTPLLLIDDIFAALDPQRLSRLIEMVATNRFGQIFLTDTGSTELLKLLGSIPGDHTLWSVGDGMATPQPTIG